ncbi:MAG: hypothetical protein ACKPKO_61310, partial [Candidatus Fonsibacter sp.]
MMSVERHRKTVTERMLQHRMAEGRIIQRIFVAFRVNIQHRGACSQVLGQALAHVLSTASAAASTMLNVEDAVPRNISHGSVSVHIPSAPGLVAPLGVTKVSSTVQSHFSVSTLCAEALFFTCTRPGNSGCGFIGQRRQAAFGGAGGTHSGLC